MGKVGVVEDGVSRFEEIPIASHVDPRAPFDQERPLITFIRMGVNHRVLLQFRISKGNAIRNQSSRTDDPEFSRPIEGFLLALLEMDHLGISFADQSFKGSLEMK